MSEKKSTSVNSLVSSPISLALILCIPVIDLLYQASDWPWSKATFHQINHSSGELAVRLLIASLVVTPLRSLFPSSQIVRWLRKRRRIMGIFSFVFAAIHVITYFVTRDLGDILGNLTSPVYIAGWVAFLILLALAATSFNGAMRKLGKKWKKLHRFAHLASIAVALHWILMSNGIPVYLHFIPLLILQAIRIYRTRKKTLRRNKQAQTK